MHSHPFSSTVLPETPGAGGLFLRGEGPARHSHSECFSHPGILQGLDGQEETHAQRNNGQVLPAGPVCVSRTFGEEEASPSDEADSQAHCG